MKLDKLNFKSTFGLYVHLNVILNAVSSIAYTEQAVQASRDSGATSIEFLLVVSTLTDKVCVFVSESQLLAGNVSVPDTIKGLSQVPSDLRKALPTSEVIIFDPATFFHSVQDDPVNDL